MLFITLVLLILKLDLKLFNNVKSFVCLNLICSCFIIGFIVYSIYIYNLNIDRTKYINYQLEQETKEYKILILPSYYTWNLNTWGSDGDFANNFKRAYGIDEDAKLIYVNMRDVQIDIDKLDVSSKLRG